MPNEEDQLLVRAKAFFEKAEKVARTGNFDYAIDMYLEGLRYWPDALKEGHLPLTELAMQRKARGGRKPSMVERVKRLHGKTPLEQMLNAEYLFIKDPDHLPYAEAMLRAAVAGGYNSTAGWIANLIFQANNDADKPSLSTYLLLKDAYAKIGDYDKALAACQYAVRLKPNDEELTDEFKNLSAEVTMARGKYNSEGDFTKAIKDREIQDKLHSQAGVIKTDDYRATAVEDARKKVAQNPDLPANIFELADALSDLETDQAENEAVSLLERTYQAKSDFSFKQKAGLLKIKQLRRKIKQTKDALKANPEDVQVKDRLGQLNKQLSDVELEHYRLCTENYPTDLRGKYEYALRLAGRGKYDEAIPLFQEAQRDPRRKIASMNQIGLCFFNKGWLTDAIDVYNSAINSHPIKDDAMGKELRYNLGRTFQQQGDSQKALEIYRRIAQVDFAYKDISRRVEQLRKENKKPTSQ